MRPSSEALCYRGAYDPLATFENLRRNEVLGTYSYIEVATDRVEIGWSPIGRLSLLSGVPCADWKEKVNEFANEARKLGRKAVGYVGFDAIDRQVGTLPDGAATGLPLVEFIIPGELLIFTADEVAHTGLEASVPKYFATQPLPRFSHEHDPELRAASKTPDSAFVDTVQSAISAIVEHNLQKIVLSRFEAYELDSDPLALLAKLLPGCPHSFMLCFGPLVAIVPSPEVLLKGNAGRIYMNPLAGTRPRGQTMEQDIQLRNELMSNHKEIVEHVLSVSAMRDEVKTACIPESVVITQFMDVVLQRNVQHLSSGICGTLLPTCEVLDALWSVFPAVTVTGIPKSAAIQSIRQLELQPRFLYSGVVGWVSGREDCHFSLAIRSVFQYRGRSYLQAGAGIMRESVAESEFLETVHKLSAMREALLNSVQAQQLQRESKRSEAAARAV